MNLFQELLNIRKDFRITFVGDEIVLTYWRLNPNDEWRPTASSYGSKISFDNFPDIWQSYFLEVMNKLNLRMAAFDYAWEDDDLNTKPYLLEVSPRFSPNPRYDPIDISYSEWKKRIFSRNSYASLQVKQIFKINTTYLKKFFKANNC